MYKIILTEEDMLNEKHFPVIALVNEACNSDILTFIQNLINRIGSGYNYTTCTFWDELDDYEKTVVPKYDGLFVETENGEETEISFTDLQHYLELAIERLSETNSQALIDEKMNELRNTLQ
ncbi:MAG: hypothetical protein HUJ72_04670 [Blautia sp.]|nr:hypothetical protein [Blautia sp.]